MLYSCPTNIYNQLESTFESSIDVICKTGLSWEILRQDNDIFLVFKSDKDFLEPNFKTGYVFKGLTPEWDFLENLEFIVENTGVYMLRLSYEYLAINMFDVLKEAISNMFIDEIHEFINVFLFERVNKDKFITELEVKYLRKINNID